MISHEFLPLSPIFNKIRFYRKSAFSYLFRKNVANAEWKTKNSLVNVMYFPPMSVGTLILLFRQPSRWLCKTFTDVTNCVINLANASLKKELKATESVF